MGRKRKIEADYHALATEKGFQWSGEILPRGVNQKTMWSCEKGHEWESRYSDIYWGRGCPTCNESKGETAVRHALQALDIPFTAQSTFPGLKDKTHLRFDFSFTLNGRMFAVEYNGKQHYEPVDFFGGLRGFRALQKRDQLKRSYAQRHNIVLIAIPYWMEDVAGFVIAVLENVLGRNTVSQLYRRRSSLPRQRAFSLPSACQMELPLFTTESNS